MKARLKSLKKGDEVGVYAHELPGRQANGAPPPLPDWCAEESDDEDEPNGSEQGDNSEESSDDIPQAGWKIVSRKMSSAKKHKEIYLCHPGAQKELELGQPDKGYQYRISTSKGVDYLVMDGADGENPDWEKVRCDDYFNECQPPREDNETPRKKTVTPLLVGMRPKDGQKKTPEKDGQGHEIR